jgi:DNA-binding MarR family transcriptional regulator
VWHLALTAGDVETRYGHMSVIGKPTDQVSLDDRVKETGCNCAAIRQAARRVTRLYDQALLPFGLRITQYPILVSLATGGPVTMRVLADKMAMDRATLGHNLRPLEAQGMVTMIAGEDRRSRVVALTEVGRRKLREARPAWHAAQETFEAAFGAEDSAALRVTMVRLARMEFG